MTILSECKDKIESKHFCNNAKNSKVTRTNILDKNFRHCVPSESRVDNRHTTSNPNEVQMENIATVINAKSKDSLGSAKYCKIAENGNLFGSQFKHRIIVQEKSLLIPKWKISVIILAHGKILQ